ncbi:unnamed protein product [Vicia faba]|uniref:HTH La-type RNA-binding domain-containing protein n=1 Tax=Vicia faba TaxID=3906 RepID=A0AAV0ZSG4_VICFA|nr:unnamed protein product [Vicia faba]
MSSPPPPPDSSSTANPAANFPRNNLTSPWAQIVRGADSDSVENKSPPESSSTSSLDSVAPPVVAAGESSNADKESNAVNPRRSAWNNLPNGAVAEVSPVMGAVSWPALSANSAKLASDASSSAEGSTSVPQGPVTLNNPREQAVANGSVEPTPPVNHGGANRQQMRRGAGNSSSNITNGPGSFPNSFSNPPPQVDLRPQAPPPPYPVIQIPPNTTFVNGVPPYRNNNGWGPRGPVGAYGVSVDEHRNPNRRGNYGNRPHNNNIRRNQDSGNINTRDVHGHQHRMQSGRFSRPTGPNSATFLGSQPIRPYVNPTGFPEYYYYPTVQLEPFGGVPFLTHPPPPAVFVPVPENPLTLAIVKQIDYYFSDVNLAKKDDYLQLNMDEQGWVPISVIANFPRVKSLTSNVELILDSLRTSSIVEVHGDKLRRRNDWMRWLPSVHQRASSGSVSQVDQIAIT